MARIYLTGSGPNRGYHTGSGILSLPARLQQQEKDHQTGSYPTIARTGDPDFSGVYNSEFDDTNTVLFVPGQLTYPMNLPASSKFVSGNIVTPSFLQGLVAAATSSVGVADAHIKISLPGQSISPFNESRLYLDNDSSFYATGTASGTLPGFAQKLSSKTILTFDTSPTTSTDFFFSTGTLPGASGLVAGVNTSMGYFNWETKRWEIIGDLTSGSNIDILNVDTDVRHSGLLPFVPSNLRNVSGELFGTGAVGPISRAHGLPFTNFGFPFASKYDATGSQMLSMSSSISHPLLIEKVSVEFSASFGPHLISISRHGPAIKQFFLMIQSPTSGSITSFTDTILVATQGGLAPGTTVDVSFPHGNQKKLVAYGQVSLMGGPDTATDYQRDLNIFTPPFVGSQRNNQKREPITGSYRLEFVPKVPSKNNFAGAAGFSSGSTRESVQPGREAAQIKVGGRTSFDIGSAGRSFVAQLGGRESSGSYNSLDEFKEPGTTDAATISISSIDSLEKTSPFVLLPSDKLIFGFCNTPNWYGITQYPNDAGNRYEKGLSDANVVLSPGTGKVTLFGSLLRNNLPVEPETNQPLTSNAIHEDLRYDIPVYDQFDVEPLSSMTGSYTDLIITGSMLATPLGDPFAKNVRSVQGSVAAGQAGITGSLQRFVSLTDSGGTMYDSYPPSLGTIYKSLGKGFASPVRKKFLVNVSAPTYSTNKKSSDRKWFSRTAYEKSSIRLRTLGFTDQSLPAYTTAADALLDGGAQHVTTNAVSTWYGSSPLFAEILSSTGLVEDAKRQGWKFVWGFGDGSYNTPTYNLISPSSINGPIIRGYKYGLAGLFGSFLDARFRRDRFGQFRDMLEQRRFPATLKRDGSVDYPISITFVSQDGGTRTSPEKTHSQNLSQYATSSLPYYDGQVVERSDNPDIVLIPVEIKASQT